MLIEDIFLPLGQYSQEPISTIPAYLLGYISISLQSEIWLGHFKTLLFLVLNHFSLALAVCVRLLTCWKLYPNLKSLSDWQGFSFRIALYLGPLILSLTLTSSLVPADEKHAQSMMLHPPCSSLEILMSKWWTVLDYVNGHGHGYGYGYGCLWTVSPVRIRVRILSQTSSCCCWFRNIFLQTLSRNMYSYWDYVTL